MNDPTHHGVVLMAVVPAVAGLLCVPLVNQRKACRAIGTLGFLTTTTLAVWLLFEAAGRGGTLVTQMGDWGAPYGITLVFDALSGLMLAAASLVALGCYVHSFGSLPARTERRYYHPMVCFLMLGVNLSFLTGDLFNLFVAFEIMLMASYGLLVIGGGKAQLRQAYKYVVMNLLASSVFVIAAGMAYGMLGTLNVADLGRRAQELAAADALPAGFTALGVLFLFVFTVKAAVFPLWFWLPDTYPTCPIAVSALFGGVLTKVGLYAIARTFPGVFLAGDAAAVLTPILVVGAAMTMFVGVLGALAYTSIRRVLSLLIIVGVGYALLGISVGSGGSLGGAAFYMAQSMVVLAGLFLACGLIERKFGTDDTARLGGLIARRDVRGVAMLGVVVFVGLMGVVGLPPTAGFYGKLVVLRESLSPPFRGAGLVGLGVGALTLLAALRLWTTTFYGPPEVGGASGDAVESAEDQRPKLTEWFAMLLLFVASVGIGVAPEPMMATARAAGQQVASPDAYRAAVLDNPAYRRPPASDDTHHDGHAGGDAHHD
ncbi:MAG: proton-conducting transporter membrane subunit [Planctomycetota bacterium]